MRTIFTLLLSALALSFTSSAYSTGLSGNLVRMAHNYPAPGTVYGNYQDAIVG